MPDYYHFTNPNWQSDIVSEFNNPNFEILLSAEQIAERVRELGAEIARDHANKELILIGILKGATFSRRSDAAD